MAAKLKLVLQNKTLLSALRPIIFGALLWLVWQWHFNIASITIFLAVNFLMYIYPLLNSLVFIGSYGITLFLAIVSLNIVAQHSLIATFFIFIWSALYYIVLNLKNIQITDRIYWHGLVNAALFYLSFFYFFINNSHYNVPKLIIIFVISFILFREFLKIVTGTLSQATNIFAFTVALLISELAWLLGWLPIGFLAATNILFMAIYGLQQYYLITIQPEGNRLIKKKIILWILIFFIIIFTSRWRL